VRAPTFPTLRRQPQDAGPSEDAGRPLQVACVIRLGGCVSSRDAGIPTIEEIQRYNRECREHRPYSGPDVTPTDEECRNPPQEPLSTAEKVLLGAFLVAGAAAAIVVVVAAAEVIIPVAIAAVEVAEGSALAATAFYYGNAIAVNEIGLFAAGLIIGCSGDVPGLLRAIANDPMQAAQLLAEVYVLHVSISVANGPPRRAKVPFEMLPANEQTAPQRVRFRAVGAPTFEGPEPEVFGPPAPPKAPAPEVFGPPAPPKAPAPEVFGPPAPPRAPAPKQNGAPARPKPSAPSVATAPPRPVPAKAPPAVAAVPPSGPRSIDARLAEAEQELNPARQKTLDYQTQRSTAGASLKGGPIKEIWDVKERIWLLKRQKAYPGRKILGQATIVGIKTQAGVITPTPEIAGKGRIADFVEFRGAKVVGGDLKSAKELETSIAGGVKRPSSIEGEFRPASKVGVQHDRETKVLNEARKQGSALVIRGRNVMTEQIETVEIDPNSYSSEVLTYEDVHPN
jgi:hypothetical protein